MCTLLWERWTLCWLFDGMESSSHIIVSFWQYTHHSRFKIMFKMPVCSFLFLHVILTITEFSAHNMDVGITCEHTQLHYWRQVYAGTESHRSPVEVTTMASTNHTATAASLMRITNTHTSCVVLKFWLRESIEHDVSPYAVLLQRTLTPTSTLVLTHPITRRGLRATRKHPAAAKSEVLFACGHLTLTFNAIIYRHHCQYPTGSRPCGLRTSSIVWHCFKALAVHTGTSCSHTYADRRR